MQHSNLSFEATRPQYSETTWLKSLEDAFTLMTLLFLFMITQQCITRITLLPIHSEFYFSTLLNGNTVVESIGIVPAVEEHNLQNKFHHRIEWKYNNDFNTSRFGGAVRYRKYSTVLFSGHTLTLQ